MHLQEVTWLQQVVNLFNYMQPVDFYINGLLPQV
jgi:hypothetical protein